MRRIRRACLAAFLLTLFFGGFGFLAIFRAVSMINYIEADGYVTNIKKIEIVGLKENRLEYDYDIHYFVNGKENISHEEKKSERPDENISTIYCSKDGSKVSLDNSEDTLKDSRLFFFISGGLYLLALFLNKITGNKSLNGLNMNYSDLSAAGIIGIIASSGGIILMLIYLIGCGKISKASVDVIIIICFILIVSIINYRTGSKIHKNIKMQKNNMTAPYNYNRYRAG